MSVLCRLGLHNWQGCKCLSCGQTRDSGHDWSHDCGVCALSALKGEGAVLVYLSPLLRPDVHSPIKTGPRQESGR